jgi:glycosyltransferase involved in cell wall biosynthesis
MTAEAPAPTSWRPGEPKGVRVDYVSPLPPVRSGIADYSRDLLPHLARHCDLRVVAVPGQEITAELEKRWRPVEADRLAQGGRLPLYHMGNNPHHQEVWKLALQTPGVVTLHDVVLHHLLIEVTLGKGDFDTYAQQLEADHGWIGRLTARARQWGELASAAVFELPTHRTLVRSQKGVLVHSHWAAFQIEEENPDVVTRVVPMGMPIPSPVPGTAQREFKDRFGLPDDRPLLGSFGFQTPIKRTDVAVRAMARPELADVRLVIAGEVSEALELERLARELGVADRVLITGFLPYSDFEAAISACDLCLNLRYPTAGETSASLLRVLSLGRPAVVSDYAVFAELPDELTVKVPLGDSEVEDLAERVGEVLATPGRLREMGEAARQFIREQHDPDLAARGFAAACREMAVLDPPGGTPATVPPPTTLLWHDLPGELEVEGLKKPWPVGEARQLSVRLLNRGEARWLPTRSKPGGVILKIQWRRERGGGSVERVCRRTGASW